MNPDWLLKHFEQISEAPDAVPRLRRFILDLAVRGKLVEQNPADEPASELLKRIEAEKAQFYKEKRLYKPRHMPVQKDRDFPCEIPAMWKWCNLAEISLKIHYGYTASANPSLQEIRLLRITDIQNNIVHWDSVPGCEIADEQTDQYLLDDGDILIARTGGTIGKSFLVKDIPVKAVFASYLIRIRGSQKLFDRYLKLFLESPVYWTQLENGSRGAGQPNVNGQTLGNMVVSVPPLAEQHRIVAKVDELMALCDELEAKQTRRERRRDRLVAATLHRMNNGNDISEVGVYSTFQGSTRFYFNHLPRLTTRPEHIQQLRQTILNLAVRGKLVPQDPNDEPASKLLRHIEAEKTRLVEDGTIRKEKPLPPVPEAELPFPVPVNWRWVRIGTLSLMTDYGTSAKSDHYEDGVPVLKMGDIQEGRVHLGGQKKVPRTSEDLPQLFLKHFDLLYNRTNSAELVGKTGIYMGEDDAYTFASYLIRIRFIRHLTSPVYANITMNAPYFRETQIMPELKQQCGQANVNGTKLKSMIIPLPPLAEQYRIVAKVDELMALSDELEAQITTTATTRRRFLEATLSEAMRHDEHGVPVRDRSSIG